jgi:hypothetical protein
MEETKAIEYYTKALNYRKAYYQKHKATSNEQSRIYHQKIYATPEMKEQYLARRREIYKTKKLQKIEDDKLYEAMKIALKDQAIFLTK